MFIPNLTTNDFHNIYKIFLQCTYSIYIKAKFEFTNFILIPAKYATFDLFNINNNQAIIIFLILIFDSRALLPYQKPQKNAAKM